MSPTHDLATVTPTEMADILDEVAACDYPQLELRDIAAKHDLDLRSLQGRLGFYGYPNAARLTASAARLRDQATQQAAKPITIVKKPMPRPAPAQQPDPPAEPPTENRSAPAPPVDQDANLELGTLQTVAVDDLTPDPDNPRDELDGIPDLATSLTQVGMLQPIVVRRADHQLIIIAGHRRHAAAIHAGWTHVPVVIRERFRTDDVLAAMLIENGQRADLDPIEEGRALNRLKIRWDCSEKDLGQRIGRNLAYVNGRRLLLTLPAELQDDVRHGRLGVTAAISKARVDAGRSRPGAQGRAAPGHLTVSHPLASQVTNRCTTLKHSRGKGVGVGGVGCGVCWDYVIRADERQRIQDASAHTGSCVSCGAAITNEEIRRATPSDLDAARRKSAVR